MDDTTVTLEVPGKEPVTTNLGAFKELSEQLALPGFEGWKFPAAKIGFSGSVELDLTDEDNRDIAESLHLGQALVVTLSVPDTGVSFQLDARVTKRGHVIQGSAGKFLTTYGVDVNGVTPDED